MRHSSTTDSKPVTIRRLALTLLCAVVALVVADQIIGILGALFIPEPPILVNDFVTTWGLDQFWRLTDSGLKPIVFTGSSTVYYGVAPHVFDNKVAELSGTQSFSMIAGATGEIASWARDLVKNIFIPHGTTAIIYATEMRAFAERGSDASWQQSALGYAMQYPPGLWKNVALWILEHSALARYRNNFHDLITGKRRMDTRFGSFDDLDDRGHSVADGIQDPNSPMDVPNDWTPLVIEPAQRQALAEMGQLCLQSNSRCIFVILPVHQTLFKVIPDSERLEFERFVKEQVNGLTVWDFNTAECIAALGDTAFKDRDHLNNSGATTFSTMLAVLYAHDFYNVPFPADSRADCVVHS